MGMLTSIAEGVYGFEQDLRLPGGMRLPSRTTIVRLADGGLVVHSPLSFDEAAVRAIDDLGEVKALVAPSCIHYLFLKAATERWPRARVLGAPGLERKSVGVAFEPLPAEGFLESLGEGDELVVLRIDGIPYITEHVFLHRASRSLVVSDLLFNVHRSDSFGMRMFLRCVGAWQKPAQSRMWRWFTKNRAAAQQGVVKVLGWDFERIVMAHGDPIEKDAPTTLRSALPWLLRPIGSQKLLGSGGLAASRRE